MGWGAMVRKNPLKESGSSRYKDFSLAEWGQSLICWPVTGKGGIFSSSCEVASLSVGDARYTSSHWDLHAWEFFLLALTPFQMRFLLTPFHTELQREEPRSDSAKRPWRASLRHVPVASGVCDLFSLKKRWILNQIRCFQLKSNVWIERVFAT